MKIVHIHTDLKFINDSENFFGKNFKNYIIILSKKSQLKTLGKYDNVVWIRPNPVGFREIINFCRDASLVVLYNLDFLKSYIANRLPSRIKIAWRFFGQELYGNLPELVYSQNTLETLKKKNFISLLNEGYYIVQKFFSKMKWKVNMENELTISLSKIDYFLGFFKEEYIFLKNFYPKLPEFIQLPIPEYFFCSENLIENKEKIIVIGNNRSPYNNHLEILNIVKQKEQSKFYSFVILFNYGIESNYTNTVRKLASDINDIKIVENFLSIEEFNNLYMRASSFVLNGYRQMALFNLFTAIKHGLKIYLNEKNITYRWFKENGFSVYTIEDFNKDLSSFNIGLNKDCMTNNFEKLNYQIKNYSRINFQEKIITKLSL